MYTVIVNPQHHPTGQWNWTLAYVRFFPELVKRPYLQPRVSCERDPSFLTSSPVEYLDLSCITVKEKKGKEKKKKRKEKKKRKLRKSKREKRKNKQKIQRASKMFHQEKTLVTKVWQSEFYSPNSWKGRRRKLTSQCCPLTSTHTVAHAHTSMCTQQTCTVIVVVILIINILKQI